MDRHYLEQELYDLVQSDSTIFDFLQDGSLDGIWYWDIQKPEHEWMSRRFKQVFGYEDHEIPNTPDWWQANIHPDDLTLALENFEAHKDDPNHPYDQIVRYKHRDGSTRWVRCRGLMIRDENGEPLRMLGAHTDVTALKQTEEELRRSNQARAAFLAAMSHEIRTPLNGVIGMAQMMQRTDLDSQQRNMLNTICDAGDGLLKIINSILDYSRLESSQFEIVPTEFELSHVLRSVEALHRVTAEEKGLELIVSGPIQMNQRFVGDKDKLKQVLHNVLGNAIKFTSAGRVTVGAQLGDSNNPAKSELILTVTDTGIGLGHVEDVDVLFSPFDQGDANVERSYGGTGLGLAICRKLLDLMGGNISAENRVDQTGSRFTITLPLQQCERAQPAAGDAGQADLADLGAQLGTSSSQHRILIAEDNRINQQVLEAMLDDDRLQLHFANNGAEALEMLQAKDYAMILMDVRMPVLDGLGATRQIRAMADTSKSETPIVALTADATMEIQQECASAGMDDYLTKPFDVARLFELVGQHVRSREEMVQ